MEELNELQETGLFLKPQQIQSGGPVPMGLMVKVDKVPSGPFKKLKNSPGRPANQPNPKKIPERYVRPKGASIVDYSENLSLFNEKADLFYSIVDSLECNDFQKFCVFSHLDETASVKDVIDKAKWLASGAAGFFVENTVLKVYNKLLKNWKKNNGGKDPEGSIKLKLKKNAWAIYRAYKDFAEKTFVQ